MLCRFRPSSRYRSERGSHQGPAPWAIGDRGLNVSTEVSTRTPRFHQPHLLWEPSSSPKPLSPVVQSGPEWLPIFGRGFRLRCFQPLSSIAWLPGSALSDNQHTQQVESDLSRDGLNPSRIPL